MEVTVEDKLMLLESAVFALIQTLIKNNTITSDEYLLSLSAASIVAQQTGKQERAELILKHIVKMKTVFQNQND